MNTYTVDRKRWITMNIFDQMGNIYSEIGRTLRAKQQNKPAESEQAMIRALDLFDATTEGLIQQRSPRVKEVLRAKDQFLQVVYTERPRKKDAEAIERYFMQFAMAARLNK